MWLHWEILSSIPCLIHNKGFCLPFRSLSVSCVCLSVGFQFWKGKKIVIHWPFPLKPEQAVHRAYSEFAFFGFYCLFFPAHSKSISQDDDGLCALLVDGSWSTPPWDKVCHLDSLSLKRYLIICKENTESFICNFSTHALVYLNPLVRCSVLCLCSYMETKQTNRICQNSLTYPEYSNIIDGRK